MMGRIICPEDGKQADNRKKGFTLAELLIVVAVVAVLVAIAIPVFTHQLERSREAADAANIRAAYADLMQEVIVNPNATEDEYGSTIWPSREIHLTQTQDGWQDKSIKESLMELFKDSPDADTLMEYVGPTHGADVALVWDVNEQHCDIDVGGIWITRDGDVTTIHFP